MSTGEAMDHAPNSSLAVRVNGAREALLLAMLIYGLVQSIEACATDRSGDVVKDLQPMVGGKPLPKAFMATGPVIDMSAASPDFRPRKFAGLEREASRPADSSFEPKPLQAASAWQRLTEYRTQGRVQLLTLWQSPSSMVSLQAGRHGGPSLQWSSRVMNRGGATRGLLDRFVASSLGAAGLRSRMAAHNAEAASAPKPISLIPGGK
jgi:hypothetical protein